MPASKSAVATKTTRETALSSPRISAAAHSVFQALKDDIVFGRLHPRERLVEFDLVSRFDCNRANIRDALNELAKLGLVEYVANKGASVIDLTIDDIQEIYAVRIELEAMAVQWIKLPVPPKAIEALETVQRRHSEAVANSDLPGIFEGNARFHDSLNNLCGNNHLIRLIKEMAFRALPIRYSAYMSQEYLNNARDDHLRLIAALKAGDRKALVTAIRVHNQRGLDWYRAQSSRQPR
jgi:DNA-binding GntR family transcriptional regulator